MEEEQYVDDAVAAIANGLIGNHTVHANEADICQVIGPTTVNRIKDTPTGTENLLAALTTPGPELTKLKTAPYPPLVARMMLDGREVGAVRVDTPYGLHQTLKAFTVLRMLSVRTTTRASLDARRSKSAGGDNSVPRILDTVNPKMPVAFNAPVVWRLVVALMKLQTHIWNVGGTQSPAFASVDGLQAYRELYTVLTDPAAIGTWTTAKTTLTGQQAADAMLETPQFQRVFCNVTTAAVERVFRPLLDDPIDGHKTLKLGMRDTAQSVAGLVHRVGQRCTDVALRPRVDALLLDFRACGFEPDAKDSAPLGPFTVLEHQSFLSQAS